MKLVDTTNEEYKKQIGDMSANILLYGNTK